MFPSYLSFHVREQTKRESLRIECVVAGHEVNSESKPEGEHRTDRNGWRDHTGVAVLRHVVDVRFDEYICSPDVVSQSLQFANESLPAPRDGGDEVGECLALDYDHFLQSVQRVVTLPKLAPHLIVSCKRPRRLLPCIDNDPAREPGFGHLIC